MVGSSSSQDVHFLFEVLRSEIQRVTTIVVSEVQAPEVDEIEPGEQVKARQQTNGPTTERAKPIVEDLNPTAGGRNPLSECFPDSTEVEEDNLQQHKVEEQDLLQCNYPNMSHKHNGRK